MNSTFNWYILHTKPGTELKLANFLSRKGYEAYCPQFVAQDNSEFATGKVLFTSWVFVQCSQEQLSEISLLGRYVTVVYKLNEPAIVSSKDIATLQLIVTQYKHLQLHKINIHLTDASVTTEDGAVSFNFPSLGFLIVAQHQRENAYQPVWIADDALQAITPSWLKKNTHFLLRRLPTLVGNRVVKISTVLSRSI